MIDSTRSGIGDAGDQVCAQVGRQHLSTVGDKVLAGRPPHGLGHAALDLPFDLLRVDRLPHVVCTDGAQDAQLACLQVHLHLHCFGDVAVGKVGRAVASQGVEGVVLGAR